MNLGGRDAIGRSGVAEVFAAAPVLRETASSSPPKLLDRLLTRFAYAITPRTKKA